MEGYDVHGYNFASYCDQLSAESKRLFVAGIDEIAVKVVEIGVVVKEIVIEDASALENYLESLTTQRVTRLILIPQQSSWGHLVVDESSLRKILTCFDVFPPFIDIIRTFGQKTGFEDDSSGGFHFRNDRKVSVYETAYLIKQAEKHGRPEAREPWSIRQMGVYHRNGGPFGDVFIIINPSFPLRQRLKCMKNSGGRPSPKALHTMILSCATENWRWYITDLEKRYLTMKDKAQLTRMDDKGEKGTSTADIRFEDTQEIQVLQDKCQQVAHDFDMDRKIIQDMQSQFAAMHSDAAQEPESDFILALVAEADIQMRRVNSMLKRLDGTIALIRTILDFQCLASLQHNSRMMTEMTRLTRQENRMMVQITKKASRDQDILKVITLIALVYLPASFVSSMMAMGYISVEDIGGKVSIHFEGEFGIFIVLTVVFLICTLAPYFWYILHIRVHESDDNEINGI